MWPIFSVPINSYGRPMFIVTPSEASISSIFVCTRLLKRDLLPMLSLTLFVLSPYLFVLSIKALAKISLQVSIKEVFVWFWVFFHTICWPWVTMWDKFQEHSSMIIIYAFMCFINANMSNIKTPFTNVLSTIW